MSWETVDEGPRPIGGLTKATLIVTIVVLVAQIFQLVFYRSFFSIGGPGQGNIETDDIGTFVAVIVAIAAFSLLSTVQIILGVVWMHRASDNVRRLVPGQRWGPGWAIGAWFIPVANLVLGFFVVREIWQGSQPDAAQTDWQKAPLPGWIIVWWILWVASYVISYTAAGISMVELFTQMFTDPASEPTEPDVFPATLASAACYLAAGVFFLVYLGRVRDLQEARNPTPALPQAL